MTEPIVTVTPSAPERLKWGDRLAGVMFFLGLLFLMALAGLIHRYPSSSEEARKQLKAASTAATMFLCTRRSRPEQ
jgi:hypothetical protein